MKALKVKIDGIENTLTHVHSSGNGHQYNTTGNKSAHTFKYKIDSYPKGTKFFTGGHQFEIL